MSRQADNLGVEARNEAAVAPLRFGRTVSGMIAIDPQTALLVADDTGRLDYDQQRLDEFSRYLAGRSWRRKLWVARFYVETQTAEAKQGIQETITALAELPKAQIITVHLTRPPFMAGPGKGRERISCNVILEAHAGLWDLDVMDCEMGGRRFDRTACVSYAAAESQPSSQWARRTLRQMLTIVGAPRKGERERHLAIHDATTVLVREGERDWREGTDIDFDVRACGWNPVAELLALLDDPQQWHKPGPTQPQVADMLTNRIPEELLEPGEQRIRAVAAAVYGAKPARGGNLTRLVESLCAV